MDTMAPLALTVSLIALLLSSLILSLLSTRRNGKKVINSSHVKLMSRKLSRVLSRRHPDNNKPGASAATTAEPRITIFYGTQTGTALRLAKELGEDLEFNQKFAACKIDVVDLEDYAETESEYQEKLKKEVFAIFIVSTYGDGEPPDGAARFYSWLYAEKKAGRQLLDNLTFTVFGLGNTQYPRFNQVAKNIQGALVALGAHPLMEAALGDSQFSIDRDFGAWKTALLPYLDEILKQKSFSIGVLRLVVSAIVNFKLDFKKRMRTKERGAQGYPFEILKTEELPVAPWSPHPLFADQDIQLSTIAVKRELQSNESSKSTLHLELDITGLNLRYEAGDHVAVFVENDDDVVADAAKCLGLPLSTIFQLSPNSGLLDPFPSPITLQTALKRYADLLSCPSQVAFAALADAATDRQEKDQLDDLADKDNIDEYKEEILAQQKSLLEVMKEFRSARPSLGIFFGLIAPPLKPRLYSISSSPALSDGRLHITCAIVNYKKPYGVRHKGVASNWLKRAVSANEAAEGIPMTPVPIRVRPSKFKLPEDPMVPVVMVGPGTGIAPFRGFLQERAAALASGQKLGPTFLFFGCRHHDRDYLYKEELEGYLRDGVLTKLFVAFSKVGHTKVYVQDLMSNEAESLYDILFNPEAPILGNIYVCGNASNMARDVHHSIINIVRRQGRVKLVTAKKIVEAMLDSRRYQCDTY